MAKVTRRNFMQQAGMGMAAMSAIGGTAKAAPSERVRHAIIGTGNQGSSHTRGFDAIEHCDIVAVCDLDPRRRAMVRQSIKNTPNVKAYEDFRRILDDPSIDSVSVVTPDHWHTPVALAALAAGKHVYVEKPCSHNIREAQALMAAMKKTGLCVQHGTQSRSGQGVKDAMQFLHEGKLGKVRMAKAINHQLRDVIGRAPVEEPPAGVNYDRWLGAAPVHAFTKNRWHYNWHWFWDYGTGDMGNDGAHQIDVARWGLNVGLPKRVTASGGQLFYDDDHETPDTQMVTFEYDDCYLVYEMRLWTDYKLEGHDNGTIFYCDDGKLEVGRKGCEVTFNGEEKKLVGGGSDFGGNLLNFVDSVKANDPSKLNAPITECGNSAILCLLGNVATRSGKQLTLAPDLSSLGNPEADALLGREYRKGYELPVV